MLDKHDIRKNRRQSTLDNAAGQGRQARDTSREGARETKLDTKRDAAKESRKTADDQTSPRKHGPGLPIRRYFTKPGDDGFTNVQWELRTATITGENGKMVFEQRDVEVPRGWSQTATNVVVQKYFRGTVGTPGARALGTPADQRAWPTPSPPGASRTATSPTPAAAETYKRRAAPPAGRAEDGVQLAGLVQRRLRARAAVLGLLHQQRRGHAWSRS